MATVLLTADDEIAQLKEKFCDDCRIIQDIGDFTHVVTVSFSAWGVKLKFQITSDFPGIPAELVVSDSGNADKTNTMVSDLEQFLKQQTSESPALISCATAAQQWLEDHGIAATKDLPHSTKRLKVNKKTPKKSEQDDIAQKKASMKTASDVIKRLQWQKGLKLDDFTVGYLDRFLGVQEKEFPAFSWNDLASVDDYSELAVPQHRIQYFKYRDTLIWDKTLRLDNVFGSTGSGITLLEVVPSSEIVSTPDCDESKILSTSTCDCSGSNLNDNADADDDDDDIQVTVPEPAKTENSMTSQLACTPAPSNKRGRPNYFVCQRITNSQITDGIKAVQDAISSQKPTFTNCFVDQETLHFTLCTLKLQSDSQVREVCDILQEARTELSMLVCRGINACVVGVDHFYDRVVIARIKLSKELMEYAEAVRSRLQRFIGDTYSYKPHVTILKLMRENERLVGCNTVPRHLYSKFRNTKFGEQRVSTIDLCAMSHFIARQEGQFYVTPLHMDLLADA